MTKTISGSFRGTSTDLSHIWQSIAQNVFENVKTNTYVKENGLYNLLIMECVFREGFSKVSGTGSKGCRRFKPTITSNGLCYTFNGESLSKMWRPSEVTETFDQIFPYFTTNKETFGGSGAVQGKLRINSSPQITNLHF